MKGPGGLIRAVEIAGYENLGPLYEWSEAGAYLLIDRVRFGEKTGAVLCYYNPPVHQVGNPGLDAYLAGLDQVLDNADEIDFLILCGANDPVHAGGDLKESLNRLDATLELKKEKEAAGATPDEVDMLFDWADMRLKKGQALHGKIRTIAKRLRVAALCGGGTRYGGSAEIPLMADYLVGDSRSGMCFSEAMIGLIPGWAGIARSLVKAGLVNTGYMCKTSREIKAGQLKEIGIYNTVVDIPFTFPKREKTGDRDADRAAYLKALDDHDRKTGEILLPLALKIATCPEGDIPVMDEKERIILAAREEVDREVARRRNPENYAHIRGKPLREVGDEIKRIGRPLAPQSIEALDGLLDDYDPSSFDEHEFVRKEMEADARLYRDPRFRIGLVATLEQRVADYREV